MPGAETVEFRTISCDEKFVYASFSDLTDYRAKKIGMWNWSGEPVKLICTDKDIVSFTVSNDTVYGIVDDEEYSYKLAKLNP